MAYVDGFIVPVPKNKLKDYARLATIAGKVWKESRRDRLSRMRRRRRQARQVDVVPAGREAEEGRGRGVLLDHLQVAQAAATRIMKKVMKDQRLAEMMRPEEDAVRRQAHDLGRVQELRRPVILRPFAPAKAAAQILGLDPRLRGDERRLLRHHSTRGEPTWTRTTPRRRAASRHRRRRRCAGFLQDRVRRDRTHAPAGRGRQTADACRDDRQWLPHLSDGRLSRVSRAMQRQQGAGPEDERRHHLRAASLRARLRRRGETRDRCRLLRDDGAVGRLLGRPLRPGAGPIWPRLELRASVGTRTERSASISQGVDLHDDDRYRAGLRRQPDREGAARAGLAGLQRGRSTREMVGTEGRGYPRAQARFPARRHVPLRDGIPAGPSDLWPVRLRTDPGAGAAGIYQRVFRREWRPHARAVPATAGQLSARTPQRGHLRGKGWRTRS